jgi:hypothetical protein
MVFRSGLCDCSIRFIKLFIMSHLPFRRSRVKTRRIYRELRQSVRNLQKSTTAEEVTYVYSTLKSCVRY